MNFPTKIYPYLLVIYLLFNCQLSTVNCQLIEDSDTSGMVLKSIYPVESKNKSRIYNSLWGKHYRNLYSIPVRVRPLDPDTLRGEMRFTQPADQFHGLFLEDKERNLYMLKPLGGSTSFIESDFFRTMYRKSDFRDTYMDTFIRDAYTMINPYTFITSSYLAEKAGLPTPRFRLFYLPPGSVQDTIADGSRIQDKIVTIIDIPDMNMRSNIKTTPEVLDLLLEDKRNHVNQDVYIRTRLFDMLVGDWNKIPENWTWLAEDTGDGIEFTPVVIDRNHAFTRADGFLFRQLLNILTLGFITDYNKKYKNIKNFNKLGYALDVAVTAQSNEEEWLKEARYLQRIFTKPLIEEAFQQLPDSIRGEEIDMLKESLVTRRDHLEELAGRYYRILQQTPVITGSRKDDLIHIDRSAQDSIHMHIYDRESGRETFHKAYQKKTTDQIWLYGLQGDDRFEVTGKAGKEKPIYLIGGKGRDSYNFDSGKKLRVYEYKDAKGTLDSIHGARTIFSDSDSLMLYDYKKTKYNTASFSLWGFYDSDLGINLGSFFTYTHYGFKRLPFTYQHRIGFNYLTGFMYQGIFPLYNEKQTFIIDATFGFPKNVYNFFGFGNDTDGYKDEKRNYNQVNVREFKVIPAFRQRLDKYNQLTVHASYELYKVRNPHDRFINTMYADDSHIFDYNSYTDIGLEYQYDRAFSRFIPHFELTLSSGWRFGLNDIKRNYPWSEARLEMDVAFSKRFTWATLLKDQVLYNDKYEFYQAATTELRGFRSKRFIGKQSFYESSDFRLDMGHLRNPILPLKYGVFAGFDWGRVWHPGEHSNKWHLSYGGGFWLIIMNKIITKYSLFGSDDTVRFMFELGLGF